MKPVSIKLHNKEALLIEWSTGEVDEIPLVEMRRHCPCATCLEEKESWSDSYIPLYHGDQIRVKNISKIGSYAIGVEWHDGHSTGIYEFAYLRQLALQAKAK